MIGAVEQYFAPRRDEMTLLVIVEILIACVARHRTEVMNFVLAKDGFHQPQVVWMKVGLGVAWRHENNVVSLVLVKALLDGKEFFLHIFAATETCGCIVGGMNTSCQALGSEILGWGGCD